MNNKKTLVSAVEAALIAAGQVPAPTAVTIDPITASAESTVNADLNVEVAGTTEEAKPEVEASPDATMTMTLEVGSSELADGITILREQLETRDEQIVDAKVQIKTLEGQVEKLEAASTGMKAIVVKSINAMQVALNHGVSNFDNDDVATVLATHAKVSADFTSNYKVGGVAAVQPEADAIEADNYDPQWAAKLAAVTVS